MFCEKANGKPWVNRAEGPHEYDCWGLVLASFREVDGFELPRLDGYSDKDCKTEDALTPDYLSKFSESQPTDGAIMTIFNSKGRLEHVGRCLCGRVLHATQGLGVRWDTYQSLTAKHINVRYYKYD